MSARASIGRGAAWKRAAQPATPSTPAKKARTAAVALPDSGAEAVKKKLMRLALDVHDGPMQNLAVIGFSLGDMRRRMQALVPEDHHTMIDSGMEQISAELLRVESELRALITALEEDGSKTIPLVEAIESEIRDFERHSSTPVTLTVSGDVRAETDSQRIAFQSVTRAALANVANHAQASRVKVDLTGTADAVTLRIEDDGCGFNPKTANPGRFGLVGMKERVELLGGEFKLTSRPGGPTKIRATLQTWRPSAE
jgi:signal transduction histidine kinase